MTAATVVVLCGRAGQAACRFDFLIGVSLDGTQIITRSGVVFQVLPQELVSLDKWQPGQQLSICAYQPAHPLFVMVNMPRSESLMVTPPGGGGVSGQQRKRRRRG